MKRISWKVWIGILLISLSVLFYFIHYLIFLDTHHIFIYLVGDIAFVPLEVLLVTLIIERLLHEREKQSLMKKLNMLIGAFFSEVGTPLTKILSGFVAELPELSNKLLIKTNWSDKDFTSAMQYIHTAEHKIDYTRGNFNQLRDFLQEKRVFLLGLLENPNLLEHESFTDLLWAVFHLTEEVSVRDPIDGLPAKDYEHLAGDIKRAYSQLIVLWLAYMKHLKQDYPYLFSLAVRINPWDVNASPVVQ